MHCHDIPIGGFQKQSLIDYAGNIACVIFTQGCNFACRYCHNSQLIDERERTVSKQYGFGSVLGWIAENRQLLDAVVFSGGEPTLHSKLPDAMSAIKALELRVKLDTNGSNPAMVRGLVEERLVDYVAMDVKAPLEYSAYYRVAQGRFDVSVFEKVLETIALLQNGSVPYEFRTTLDETFSADSVQSIAGSVKGAYFVQNRRDEHGKVVQYISPEQFDPARIR